MALIGASNSLGGLAGSNALARLLVVISGDSSQLTTALAKSEASLKGFASNASTLGSALTRSITLPFLAIGGAAVKVASDFNFALTRVAALTPILEDSNLSFQQLEDTILEIANRPDVVATPVELANALYFAGSAGLTASAGVSSAAKAFDVVRLSAQAASVGMGEAADISKVLIFAMNNYADSGLTATQAMDALTVAIREGTAEPQEMAIALGRLLPIAHQAGVSFQEVVASVAALTNLGVPARVATTSLRALFSELLAPTKAATEQLNALGITADQLRFKLQQGPIEAFKLLTDVTKGNVDQLRQIIPQIRGITAFYGLAGTQAEKYAEIIDRVNNSQGSLQVVIDQFMNTPTFKFKKALQELTLAGIELGNQLIPVFTQLVGVIQDLAQMFVSLPGPVQKAFAAFLVFGAAAGPLLKLYGTIAAFGEGGVVAIKALATGFLTAGIAAGIATGGFLSLVHGSTSLISIGSTLVGTIIAVQLALKALSIAAVAGKLGYNLFSGALAGLSSGGILAIAAAVGALATYIGITAGKAARAKADIDALDASLLSAAKSGVSLGEALRSPEIPAHLRDAIQAYAEVAGILQQPVGQALPQVLEQINGEISSNLANVSNLTGGVLGLSAGFKETALAASGFVAAGMEWGDAVRAAGGDADKFYHDLQNIIDAGNIDDSVQGSATAIQDLIGKYAGVSSAIDQYNADLVASFVIQDLQKSKIQEMADATGTSVEYIQQKIGEIPIDFAAASEASVDTWKRAAFGVDHNNQLISGSVAEMRQQVTTEMTDMSKLVAEAFNIFDKLPKDATKSFDVYLQRLQDVNDAQLQLNQDLKNLGARGVPTDLVKKILGEGGPDLIHRFAAATDKDLKKYVRAIQVNMALGDTAVQKEGIHLEGKAKANIEGFADATLSAGKLTTAAANTIVQNMTAAFISGNLRGTAFDLMIDFLGGIRSTEGLTKKQASAAALAFSRELTNSHNFNKDGTLIIHQVATGIHNATGIPISKVNKMLSGMITAMRNRRAIEEQEGRLAAAAFARGVRNQYDDARQAGGGLMLALAHGITAGINEVASAIQAAAQKVKQGLDQGLKNSPEYASYYMGIKYANDFTKGMKTVNLEQDVVKTLGRRSHTRVASKDMSPGRNHSTRPIRLDRRHVAEELAVDSDYRGW